MKSYRYKTLFIPVLSSGIIIYFGDFQYQIKASYSPPQLENYVFLDEYYGYPSMRFYI